MSYDYARALAIGVLAAILLSEARLTANTVETASDNKLKEFVVYARVASLKLIDGRDSSFGPHAPSATYDVGQFPVWQLVFEVVQVGENPLSLQAGQTVCFRIDRQTHMTCRLSEEGDSPGIARYTISVTQNDAGESQVVMILRSRPSNVIGPM